jgi:hypothetical protein
LSPFTIFYLLFDVQVTLPLAGLGDLLAAVETVSLSFGANKTSQPWLFQDQSVTSLGRHSGSK